MREKEGCEGGGIGCGGGEVLWGGGGRRKGRGSSNMAAFLIDISSLAP